MAKPEDMQENTGQALDAKRAGNKKPYKGVAMEGMIARWYSRNQRGFIEQYKSWAKLVGEHLREGSKVLEVAPGPGYLSVELAGMGKYEITGLDISETFVEIARGKAAEANVHIDFKQGDAAAMPLADGSIDFAVCTSAFKNFPDPVRVLNQVFRVLKGGGEALIIDLRREASKAEIDDYVSGMQLGMISSLTTKFIFKHSLLNSAYTRGQVQEFARQSEFGGCEILDEGVGFEMWLRKP